jgi:hypothetical protein
MILTELMLTCGIYILAMVNLRKLHESHLQKGRIEEDRISSIRKDLSEQNRLRMIYSKLALSFLVVVNQSAAQAESRRMIREYKESENKRLQDELYDVKKLSVH